MDEQTFQEKLTHLLDRISDLPPEQQAALLQAIEQTGQRRRRQADPAAEHAGGQARLAGQYLQDHQLHGGQPTEAGQTLGVHLPRLLQAPQGLEKRHLECHDR